MNIISKMIIRLATGKPFFHLNTGDGEVYMERCSGQTLKKMYYVVTYF